MKKILALTCACGVISCTPSLATRFEKGSQALSTGAGAAYFVRVGPILQDALNSCMPSGSRPPSPTIMLLADITEAGAATQVLVEPDSAGTRCVAEQFGKARFPPPPVAAGEETFPIGIRVDLKK